MQKTMYDAGKDIVEKEPSVATVEVWDCNVAAKCVLIPFCRFKCLTYTTGCTTSRAWV